MNRRSAIFAAAIVTLCLVFGTATAGAADVSFKGKTVAILIPYSVGGAADIMARQMLPFIGKQIPGNPTAIIKNMPGGGGIVGENWVYNSAPADGTVIGQFSTSVTDTIFKPGKVKFELAKLQWLGGVRETTVTFVSKDLGITKGTELGAVKKKLFFGTTSIQSPRSMIPRLLLKILGKDHKLVTGYGSSGDMRAAIRRGELNMTNDSQSGYFAAVLPMVEEGAVVPIAQEGTVQDGKIIRDPRLPDLPTYYEIVLELKGESIRKDPNYRAMELLAYLGGVRRGWGLRGAGPQGCLQHHGGELRPVPEGQGDDRPLQEGHRLPARVPERARRPVHHRQGRRDPEARSGSPGDPQGHGEEALILRLRYARATLRSGRTGTARRADRSSLSPASTGRP